MGIKTLLACLAFMLLFALPAWGADEPLVSPHFKLESLDGPDIALRDLLLEYDNLVISFWEIH